MLELPEELIINIFAYISANQLMHVARCCSKFNRISKDRSLWKEKGFIINKSNQEELRILFKAFPVEFLEFTNNPTNEDLELVGKYCPQLKYLSIFGVRDIDAFGLSKICNGLESLEIYAYDNEEYSCYGCIYDEYTDLSSMTLGVILEGLYELLEKTSIKTLKLWEFMIPSDHLIRITEKSPELRYLSITHCFNLTNKILEEMLINSPNIERFYVDEIACLAEDEDYNTLITNPHIQKILPINLHYNSFP